MLAPAEGTFDDDLSGYADDLATIFWSLEDMVYCVNLLFQVFLEYGLAVNLDKTKTVVFNWNSDVDGEYPESILSINEEQIENCTSFKYLGVWFTGNTFSIGQDELSYRINLAQNAFAEHRKLLTNMNIKIRTRVQFLESLVRSRLTYGCHSWRPTQPEMDKIETTYRFFLRRMIWNGYTRVNPPPRNPSQNQPSVSQTSDVEENEIDWRFVINNDRLYQITCATSIKEFYERQQINWIAHIIRRENNNVCKVLTFHSTKRTKVGRKSPSILERAVAASGVSFTQFLKDSFEKNNRQGHPGAGM